MSDQSDSTTTQHASLFEADKSGGSFGFVPRPAKLATAASPGSHEKLEILRARVERGESLWHPSDRTDFAGINGIVRTPFKRYEE